MKFFNKFKILMIILLGVTILAAVISSFKINEGFKDEVVGCSGEIVPECHDSVLKYSEFDNSDYILKTEMVVPTCPMCPTRKGDSLYANHDHKDKDDDYSNESKWDDDEKDKKDDKGEDDKGEDDTEETDKNEKKKEKKERKEKNEKEEREKEKNEKERIEKEEKETISGKDGRAGKDGKDGKAGKDGKDAMPQIVTIAGQKIQTVPNVGLAGSGEFNITTPSPVSVPANVDHQSILDSIKDIKNQLTAITNKEPEPAFECKKVPNYRSPYTQNYLPLPVLNDFSKF